MHIDVESVSGAAAAVLDESVDLRVAWQDEAPRLTSMPPTASGNSEHGPTLVVVHEEFAEFASGALDAMAAVLEMTAEALFDCVYCLSSADDATAESFRLR